MKVLANVVIGLVKGPEQGFSGYFKLVLLCRFILLQDPLFTYLFTEPGRFLQKPPRLYLPPRFCVAWVR
jgi:hypothetical protein